MSEIHILLLCGLFFMPIAVILGMGVFWAYIWVKDGLIRVDEEEKRVMAAIAKLPKSAKVVGRGTLVMDPKDVISSPEFKKKAKEIQKVIFPSKKRAKKK